MQSRLEQAQRRNDELQARVEVLRAANEELELRSRVLDASRVRLEAEQRKLEAASRYKSEFLANMSHELRTPLNSALILSKLLAENRDRNLSVEQVRYAKAIHSSNADLLTLINDLLDLAKIESGFLDLRTGDLEIAVLLERLRATFEPLAAEKSLDLRIALDADVPPAIVTDSLRIAQILKNLLSNAVKFTERGHVHVRVSLRADERLAFEVCDSGIGVAREQRALIFEAFRQADSGTSRRFSGTGLGLSISRELARRLGGEIEVDSEPGRGSVFTLLLPLQWAPPTGSQPADVAQQPDSTVALLSEAAAATASVVLNGRRILLVEDDVRNVFALSSVFEPLGAKLEIARNGREALARLEMQPRIELVLMDIMMPGMDGLTAIGHIRDDPRWVDLPVIAVTAKAMPEDRESCLRAGANGYIARPIQVDKLISLCCVWMPKQGECET